MFWFSFLWGCPAPRVTQGQSCCLREGLPPALLLLVLLLFIFSSSTTERDGRGLKRAGGGRFPSQLSVAKIGLLLKEGSTQEKIMYFPSSETHRFCCGFSLLSCLRCPPGWGRGGYPIPTAGQSRGVGGGAHGETPGVVWGAVRGA